MTWSAWISFTYIANIFNVFVCVCLCVCISALMVQGTRPAQPPLYRIQDLCGKQQHSAASTASTNFFSYSTSILKLHNVALLRLAFLPAPPPYVPLSIYVRLVIVVNPFIRPGQCAELQSASWVVQSSAEEPDDFAIPSTTHLRHSTAPLHYNKSTRSMCLFRLIRMCNRPSHNHANTNTHHTYNQTNQQNTLAVFFATHTMDPLSMWKYACWKIPKST